jgi:hypothetical protein
MPDIVQKTDASLGVARLHTRRKSAIHFSLAVERHAVRALPFQSP